MKTKDVTFTEKMRDASRELAYARQAIEGCRNKDTVYEIVRRLERAGAHIQSARNLAADAMEVM